MQSSFDQMLPSLVADIARNYEAEEIFFTKPGLCFPSRSVIIEIKKQYNTSPVGHYLD